MTLKVPPKEEASCHPNTLSQVLFVDDDEDSGEMLSLLLRSHRIEVTRARSAAEAWPKIESGCFSLYLLDVWLRQLDGLELCRQIRERDSTTPILFYSGAAYDADKQAGIAAGANAYVTKPDVEGLVAVLLRLIEESRLFHVSARLGSNQPHPAEKWFPAQFLNVEPA